MYQKDKYSDSKVKFRHASNRCKRALEAAKLAYANKTKESITSQKRGSGDFLRIANSVFNKLNLLYLLYSMAQRCSLLHLINENGFLKTFLRTLFLMTRQSLYLFSFLELIWNCITGATRAAALDIFKNFGRVWHPGILHKLQVTYLEFQVRYLALFFLFSVIVGFGWFWSLIQEYPGNAGARQGSIQSPTLFLLYINDLLDDIICNIATYADDTTLYSKCDQASDVW